MKMKLNFGEICKIAHPLTRAAIMSDRHNKQLRTAFPECFTGESTPVPWSFIAPLEDKYRKLWPNHFTYSEFAKVLIEKEGLPVCHFIGFNDKYGDREEDLQDTSRHYLFPENVNEEWHPAFFGNEGETVLIQGTKFVIIGVDQNHDLVVLPVEMVNMMK